MFAKFLRFAIGCKQMFSLMACLDPGIEFHYNNSHLDTYQLS